MDKIKLKGFSPKGTPPTPEAVKFESEAVEEQARALGFCDMFGWRATMDDAMDYADKIGGIHTTTAAYVALNSHARLIAMDMVAKDAEREKVEYKEVASDNTYILVNFGQDYEDAFEVEGFYVIECEDEETVDSVKEVAQFMTSRLSADEEFRFGAEGYVVNGHICRHGFSLKHITEAEYDTLMNVCSNQEGNVYWCGALPDWSSFEIALDVYKELQRE